jgi:hypothetical protein
MSGSFIVMNISGTAATRRPGTTDSRLESLVRTVPTQQEVTVPYIGAPHSGYNSSPPTSGAHVPQTLAPGIYRSPVPDELQVSVLTHGHVMVQYSLRTPYPDIRKLEGVIRSHFRTVVLAPRPELPDGVTLTAWGRVAHLETVDVDLARRFVAAYGQ